MVRTGIDSTQRSSNKYITVEDGLKADRLLNVHRANRSPGFPILVLLPHHAVSERLPGWQPVICSKGSSAVKGKCLVLLLGAAADGSHIVC